MPPWFLDEPHSLPGDEFYLEAFSHLSSCRAIGMGIGPIPWNFIVDYAERHDLTDDFRDVFVAVIEAMDAGWMKWQRSESERKRAAGGP